MVKRDHLRKERERERESTNSNVCGGTREASQRERERELTMARPSKSMWTKSAGLGLDRTPSS